MMRLKILTVAAILSLAVASTAARAQGIGTPDYDVRYGKEYLAAKEYDLAAMRFRQAIAMDPGHAEAHWLLASAYLFLGRVDDAQAELRRAYELDPALRERQGELPTPPTPATATPPSEKTGLKAPPDGPAPKPQAPEPAKPVPATGADAASCDALYSACYVTATRCGMDGCRTDYARQGQCLTERNACYARNGVR